MDTEEIKQTEIKHLGIKRNNKNNIDIEDRIKLARRTIYALLGPTFAIWFVHTDLSLYNSIFYSVFVL
jgi:hypothetical protein